MPSNRRYSLRELSPKDYSLYRVICMELESLGHEIQIEGTLGTDLTALSTAMQDRRLLVEWLRQLMFPPAALYNDCGITEEVEELLLREAE
jgi:hypothetical protein